MISNSAERLVVYEGPIIGEPVTDAVQAVVIIEPRRLVNPRHIAGDAPWYVEDSEQGIVTLIRGGMRNEISLQEV